MAAVRHDARAPAGNFLAIDLVECLGLCKSLRLAVGIGGRHAALFPRSQATIDAVAVGVIGDDEHAPLGLRSVGKPDQSGETDQYCSHEEMPMYGGTRPPRAERRFQECEQNR